MDRTEEFEKINRELERANQIKGRFIANMSHELRTPLRKNIRGSDVIVRYGGDAFAIILPSTVITAGLSLSNRFNAIIKNYPFLYEESQPKDRITASLGLASLDGQSTEEFVLCAEKALALAIVIFRIKPA